LAGLAAQAGRSGRTWSETQNIMIDFANARRVMVDGQIRPNDVTDRDLIAAMLDVPRERFVPPALASVAYVDRDLPVDDQRMLLKPMVLARLIQAAEVGTDDRVLDVACGTGYSSAILARRAATVVALEDDAARARRCTETLAQLGVPNVTTACGPLDAGWPALAPYGVILVNGACEVEPHELFAQLKEGGRLVGILGGGHGGKAMLYRKDRGEIGGRILFDASAPVLPAFKKVAAFVF
jgi:protein-L-isoaspartate(D-aspartate) O-methyltransferase